jgi:hypothetical protein
MGLQARNGLFSAEPEQFQVEVDHKKRQDTQQLVSAHFSGE